MENLNLQAFEECSLDADDHLARPILSLTFDFEVPLFRVQLDCSRVGSRGLGRAP